MVEARPVTQKPKVVKKVQAVEETKSASMPSSGGDETTYWTVSYGEAVRNGWSCRACKKGIMKGAKMAIRDGRKLRLHYHL